MAEDDLNTGVRWKELKEMGRENNINVDKAWSSVVTRIDENGLKTGNDEGFVRTGWGTLLRIAAVALILFSLGLTTVYLRNSGYLSKKITVVTSAEQKNLKVDLKEFNNKCENIH